MNFHVWNRGLKNQTEKVPCTVSLNVPKFLFSLCLQGLFQTFIACNYCTQFSALSFEKKIFSLEMDKMTSISGVQANKMPFFQKICPKNHTHAPNVQNRPRFNIFLVFNTHSVHNLHRAIATSIFNIGTTRKLLLCNFNF